MSDRAAGGTPVAPPDNQLEELQELLGGPQRQELQRLQARIDGLHFTASAVARVLPEAISLQSREPSAPISQALLPLVEDALIASVRQDREQIAELLYPIIGPAIRKSIAEALSGLVQSLNQALEHSLSPRGLLWRIEAMRTGVSFGEVVLRHNLLFRVEQVFLIDKRTGLPMGHVAAKEVVAQDSSLVSGMLTALQDFVRDSFTTAHGDGLDMLKVGELNVWIEQGPSAILAAVIRGSAPESLRPTLRLVLETIHVRHAAALARFDGDASGISDARPLLESCLATRYKPQQARPSLLLVLLLLGLLGGLGRLGYGAWRQAAKWDALVVRLRAEHGIVVSAQGRQGGRYYLRGLRDPLAAEPQQLLRENGIDPSGVEMAWEEYHSLFPEFLLTRIRRALDPPSGVRISLRGRRAIAEGRAAHRWLSEARRLARAIAGIEGYDDSAVEDMDRLAIAEARAAIEQTQLIFPPLIATLSPSMNDTLAKLAGFMRRLYLGALALDSMVQIRVVGQADIRGTDAQNLALSRQRADAVADALRVRGIPFPVLLPTGIGAPHNSRTASLPGESETDRKVAFAVELFGAAQAGSSRP